MKGRAQIAVYLLVGIYLLYVFWPESDNSGQKFDITPTQSFRTESDCLIKGNVSYKTGEKIYHLSNCPYYNSTVINESYGERWFCSEAEAIKAGWRKAYNCP